MADHTPGGTVRLSAELRYDADPSTVYEMISDPDFQERKLANTGAVSYDVTVDPHEDGGVTVTSRRELPTDRVPEFVKGFVGSTIKIEQVEEWEAVEADGVRNGSLVADVSGMPVKFTARLSLVPNSDGTLEVVQGDLKASVPLIGGKVEKAAEPAIKAAVAAEQRTGREWLAAR
jgi:hypothetical protein